MNQSMEQTPDITRARYGDVQFSTIKRGLASNHNQIIPAIASSRVALTLAALLVNPTCSIPTPTSNLQPLASSSVPSVGTLCSASSCEDLGWTNAASFGSSTVCGETKAMSGTCPRQQSWDAAKALCQAAGARLCSASELEANEARGTGCDYDNELVWSATSCADSNSFEVAYGAKLGGNSGIECVNHNDMSIAAVRCCADTLGACQPSAPLELDEDADVRNLNYYYTSYYTYEDDTGPSDDGTPADIIDNFNAFDDGLWNAQCAGCTFVDGSLFIKGDSQLMRTYEKIADISRIKGTLVKNSMCNDHFLGVSTVTDLSWNWGSTRGSARFLWNCNSKLIYGQSTSSRLISCSAYREYAIDIALTASTLYFSDDYCGTVSLSDYIGDTSSLFVYLGADDDDGSAQWESVSIWGNPTWDIDASRPTFSPVHMPTAVPPTVSPTSVPDLSDNFASFDSGIWQTLCTGCTYEDGSLLVTGSSMLMRTVGSISDLANIRGELVRGDTCSDHGVLISSSRSAEWYLGFTPGAVFFTWNCGTKMIYGQSLSAADYSCSGLGTYAINIEFSSTVVSFSDSTCGSLTLAETLAGSSSALYVYVGADNDLGASKWNALRIWGEPSWNPDDSRSPTIQPVLNPTPQPTYRPTPEPSVPWPVASVVDEFDAFDEKLWDTPCAGCSFNASTLLVSGDSQLMRSRGAFSHLTRLKGSLVKDAYCNDHALIVSTSPEMEWSWAPGTGAVRLMWNCGSKYLSGQTNSVYQACSSYQAYTVVGSFSTSEVAFSDDECGSLSLDDSLVSSDPLLYVWIGADDDSGTATWNYLSIWGSMTWDPDDSRVPTVDPSHAPSHLPVLQPTAQPSVQKTFTPSPEPTMPLGDALVSDNFTAFDSGLWLDQCVGCSYLEHGGGLSVAGDSQAMRTIGLLEGLYHVEGVLIRAGSCSDHFVYISTNPQLSWSWSSSAGTVKAAWNCGYKYLYGSTLSSTAVCSSEGTYTIDVSVVKDKVTFADDKCGVLSLPDSLGSNDALYVYLGADNDAAASVWNSVSLWATDITWDPTGSRAPTAQPVLHPTTQPVLSPSPHPTVSLGVATFVDAFDAFQDGLWDTQCTGCAYANSSLYISGDSQLMRSEGTFTGLTHLRGVLVKDEYCNDHFLGISTLSDLDWAWGSTESSARFVWSCSTRHLYGQVRSVYAPCSTYRTYTVEVSITASTIAFGDDYCGTLRVDDNLGTAPFLYVYIGADDDSGTAEWEALTVWGAPTWNINATRAPTLQPSNLPSLHPLMSPTPEPTLDFGAPAVFDDFDAFEASLWAEQCPGCAYEAGHLLVSGDSMLMRSWSTFGGLSRIQGHFVKDHHCNDHGVAISNSSSLEWSWNYAEGTARFLWNCDTKRLLGQTHSASTTCSTYRAYTITLSIGVKHLSFMDDLCGTLVLNDVIGHSPNLYVYVGADDDAGTATWLDFSIWGYPSWNVDMSRAPVPQPTPPAPLPTAFVPEVATAFTDNFEAFQPKLWLEQCSSCIYDGSGKLLMRGNNMAMRTAFTLKSLSHLRASFIKDSTCNDHAITITSSADLSWTWYYMPGTLRFLWNCDAKTIYGQTQTLNVACFAQRTYVIDVSLGVDSVAFTDDYCGSLVIVDTLVATESSLYVMIGADDDEGTATWLSLSVWGEPEWLETLEPTLVPTAAPTSLDTASTQVVLWLEADTANDVTADMVASAVASVIDDVDVSMVKHFVLLAGSTRSRGAGDRRADSTGDSPVSSRESFLSTSAGSESSLLQVALPSMPRQRVAVESVTVGFTIEASLDALGLQSPTEFEAKVADSLTESIDNGSFSSSLSSSCGCSLAAERVEVTLVVRPTPSPSHIPSSASDSGNGSDDDAESSSSSASTSSVGLIVGLCAAVLVCIALGWAAWRRAMGGKGGNRVGSLLDGLGSNSSDSEYYEFNGGTFSPPGHENAGLPNPLIGNHRGSSAFSDSTIDGIANAMGRDKRGSRVGVRGPWLGSSSSARSKEASVELQGLTSSSSSSSAAEAAAIETNHCTGDTTAAASAAPQQPKSSSSGKADGISGGSTAAAEAGFLLGENVGLRDSSSSNSHTTTSCSSSSTSTSSNYLGSAGVGVKLVGLGTKPKGGYVPPTLDEDDDDDEDRPVVMV